MFSFPSEERERERERDRETYELASVSLNDDDDIEHIMASGLTTRRLPWYLQPVPEGWGNLPEEPRRGPWTRSSSSRARRWFWYLSAFHCLFFLFPLIAQFVLIVDLLLSLWTFALINFDLLEDFFRKLQIFEGFFGSDLNEEVPNHPANERTVKHLDTPPDLSLSLLLLFSSSSYFHSFSKKMKIKYLHNMNVLRFSSPPDLSLSLLLSFSSSSYFLSFSKKKRKKKKEKFK